MRITRNLSALVVRSDDSLACAMARMSGNAARLVFAVSAGGRLEGVLTDGDLRRWLTRASVPDLEAPVAAAMNRDCVVAGEDAPPARLRALLDHRVLAVPVVDAHGRIRAVALGGKERMEIEGRVIEPQGPAFLIAEIGNNHQGDLALARRLIDAAAAAGADCAKFQMRDMASLYRDTGDAGADLGAQYTLDLLARFQLDDADLFRAFDHCRRRGLVPLCTAWDLASLEKLEAYGLQAYKVASADFTHYDLLDAVAATGRPMFCSTGMSSEAEVRDGIRRLQQAGADFLLLHCNSTYPAPFKDVNLRYMQRLAELGGGMVGYSGHERDVNVAVAAVALGAKVIEKHFTLDRGLEGNDHRISLLPEELARMVEGIRQVELALGGSGERRVSQGELMNRENLAKSLVAACDIPAGTPVSAAMVQVCSPGQGLQPNRKAELIGRILAAPKRAGECFFPADLGEGGGQARDYRFALPWGIPVRYHDMHALRARSNPQLLEIHLSYRDMELDFRRFIDAPLELDLVVHAPELFAGDHTLDLCAEDESYRLRSVAHLQRVIDLTRELAGFFRGARPPRIVVNVGGFSRRGHLPAPELAPLHVRLERSLAGLDGAGVELLPQTMPPFPWHFGGQQFHNLFVDADSIAAFCTRTGMRVCLDASHSRLACNHLRESFAGFLRKVLPHTAHMHLADAGGVDQEGLQIGEGEIDWREFFRLVSTLPQPPSFIPEVWQGHKNGGEGLWKALALLEPAALPAFLPSAA